MGGVTVHLFSSHCHCMQRPPCNLFLRPRVVPTVRRLLRPGTHVMLHGLVSRTARYPTAARYPMRHGLEGSSISWP